MLRHLYLCFSFETLPSQLVTVVESNFKKHCEKIKIWRTNTAVSLGKKKGMAHRIPFGLCSSPASLHTPGRSFLEPSMRANSGWVEKKHQSLQRRLPAQRHDPNPSKAEAIPKRKKKSKNILLFFSLFFVCTAHVSKQFSAIHCMSHNSFQSHLGGGEINCVTTIWPHNHKIGWTGTLGEMLHGVQASRQHKVSWECCCAISGQQSTWAGITCAQQVMVPAICIRKDHIWRFLNQP